MDLLLFFPPSKHDNPPSNKARNPGYLSIQLAVIIKFHERNI